MDVPGVQHKADACRVGNFFVSVFGVGGMENDVCLSANQCRQYGCVCLQSVFCNDADNLVFSVLEQGGYFPYTGCQLFVGVGGVFDDECRPVCIFGEGFHDVAGQVILMLFHLVCYVIV